MPKSVSLPFQLFTNGAMASTNTITSSLVNIMYRDSVAIQLVWTGTPNGTFAVYGSNSYNPGSPQSDGTYNAGTWTAVTLSATPTAAGSASDSLINMNQLAFAWLKVTYTNTSGTGVVNGWITAKSLGV